MIEPPAKLLWTGGWDSTYRLLTLLLVESRVVQPYYFEIPRRSAEREREAMRSVREELGRRRPEAAGRLLPTILVPVDSLPPNPIEAGQLASLRALREGRRLGGQYSILAAAAARDRLDGLELGLHEEEGSAWFALLRANIISDPGSVWRLVERPDPPSLELFRRFAFPLLTLSKREMAARAEAAGFADLLTLTWFCHEPDRRGRPCGLCAPCRMTVKQGLGHRIPAFRRVRSRLAWPLIVLLHRLGARRRLRSAWHRARGVLEGAR